MYQKVCLGPHYLHDALNVVWQYDAIPVEVNGPGSEEIQPLSSFEELGMSLPAFLKRNVALMKYASPTPIQKHAIPLAISGKDLMCCAQVKILCACPCDFIPTFYCRRQLVAFPGSA
jgi:hypothetical protein